MTEEFQPRIFQDKVLNNRWCMIRADLKLVTLSKPNEHKNFDFGYGSDNDAISFKLLPESIEIIGLVPLNEKGFLIICKNTIYLVYGSTANNIKYISYGYEYIFTKCIPGDWYQHEKCEKCGCELGSYYLSDNGAICTNCYNDLYEDYN